MTEGGGGGGGLEREIENPLRKSGWLGDVGGENKKYTVETSSDRTIMFFVSVTIF